MSGGDGGLALIDGSKGFDAIGVEFPKQFGNGKPVCAGVFQHPGWGEQRRIFENIRPAFTAVLSSGSPVRAPEAADFATNREAAEDAKIPRPPIAGLRSGALGYTRAFQYRQPTPWPWLPGAPRDLVGDREEQLITSVLRDINPLFEVFKREN